MKAQGSEEDCLRCTHPGNDLLDHAGVFDTGEFDVEVIKPVGEPFVIEPELMQYDRRQVVDTCFVAYCFSAQR